MTLVPLLRSSRFTFTQITREVTASKTIFAPTFVAQTVVVIDRANFPQLLDRILPIVIEAFSFRAKMLACPFLVELQYHELH